MRGAEPSPPDRSLYDPQHDRSVLIPSQSNRPMTKQRFAMCSWRDRDHPGVAEGHRRASRQTRVSYIHAHVHTHAESKKPMHAAYTRARARTPGRSSRGPRSGIWQRTEVRWPHLRDAGNVVGVARVSGTFTSPARDEPGFGRLRASLESAWETRDRARERGDAGADRSGGGRG